MAGSYSVGAEEKLEIIATVDNEGEDAFNARLYVQIPPGVQYINAKSSSSAVPVLCSEPNAATNNTLTCNIGNPLPANTQACYITHILFGALTAFKWMIPRGTWFMASDDICSIYNLLHYHGKQQNIALKSQSESNG